MQIGQRIKIKRGDGMQYGTITGLSRSPFDGGEIFIIAIDGHENEYAVHAESLVEVRKKRNVVVREKRKENDNKTKGV